MCKSVLQLADESDTEPEKIASFSYRFFTHKYFFEKMLFSVNLKLNMKSFILQVHTQRRNINFTT